MLTNETDEILLVCEKCKLVSWLMETSLGSSEMNSIDTTHFLKATESCTLLPQHSEASRIKTEYEDNAKGQRTSECYERTGCSPELFPGNELSKPQHALFEGNSKLEKEREVLLSKGEDNPTTPSEESKEEIKLSVREQEARDQKQPGRKVTSNTCDEPEHVAPDKGSSLKELNGLEELSTSSTNVTQKSKKHRKAHSNKEEIVYVKRKDDLRGRYHSRKGCYKAKQPITLSLAKKQQRKRHC